MPTKEEIEFIQKLRKSAKLYSHKIIGGQHWCKMDEMLDAISIYPNVAIRSGHGVSKSHTLARIALWFLSCFAPSKVVMIAPTQRQVKDIFWSEVETLYYQIEKRHPGLIGGKLINLELDLEPNWFMKAFKTKDLDVNAFAGFHSPNVLLIFDEACGIKRMFWDAAEGIKTGVVVRHIVASQFHDPNSEFGKCFKDKSWHKIHISAEESPNITGECFIPGLATKEWVDDKKIKWGVDSSLYQVRVLGNAPLESSDTLISLAKIQKAIERDRLQTKPLVMGIDVARFGDDKTIFKIMDVSGKEIKRHEESKQDTMYIAGVAGRFIDENNIYLTGIDTIGIGAGVYDRLVELNQKVIAVEVSREPIKGLTEESEVNFVNLRAQIHWLVREEIENMCLIDDGYTVADLSDIRYKIKSDKKIQIEAKADFKKRTGRSPDDGEATMIALYTAKQLLRNVSIADIMTSNFRDETDEPREDFKEAFVSVRDKMKRDWV